MNFKPLAGLAALAVASFINTGLARAQEEVRLTPIEMVESKDTIDHITQTDMERKTATNLWEAMKGTLGVYQNAAGNRSEGRLSIRGSRNDQIGMFVDDIPTATAWTNEWDMNNTMLYDLESIEVSKGYSSPLLASNNGLSGVLNLRTAKPTKELEFSAKYMNFFDRELDDQGRFFATGIGTRQELFYLKATVMQNQRDFFTLPSSFSDAPNEDSGRRKNSDFKNRAVNLIAGWTPTEDADIMFGFVRQQHEKGQPPNAAQFQNTREWNKYVRWPEYETDRYYLNGNVNLDEKAHFKTVLYYDGHKDKQQGFTDTNYNVPGYYAGYRQTSSYDQYTAGGQLTFDYTFNKANKLAVSTGYRRLSHKHIAAGNIAASPTTFIGTYLNTHAVEDYLDLGAEYTLKPRGGDDPLTLVFGTSYSHATPKTIERWRDGNYPAGRLAEFEKPDEVDIFDYQVGAFYDLTENHELFATFAKKSSFASMDKRYDRIPIDHNDPAQAGAPMNPDLKPEQAFHYELGYRGLIQDWLKINSSIYYKNVKDIALRGNSITYPVQGGGTSTYSPYINASEADFYGLELGAEALFNQYFSAGLTFNYLEWDNDTGRPGVVVNLTQLPKYTSTVYAVIAPLEGLSIIPQVNMSSGFYWESDPTETYDPRNIYEETGGFTTADLKVVYDLNEHLTFELGARNITDKEYAYSAYFPEQGRNFFLGLTGRY